MWGRRVLGIYGRSAWFAATVGAIAVGVAGCASITSGTTQSINISSTPDEADCVLFREGKQIATVRTPAPVTVSRTSKAIRVVCNKPGYNAGESALDAQMEAATMGNLILGGAVGLVVDAASGASQRYPGFVTVGLTPVGGMPASAPATAAGPAAPTSATGPAQRAPGLASEPVIEAPSPVEPAAGQSRSRL